MSRSGGLDLLIELFADLPRQGPGSADDTLEALRRLGPPRRNGVIVDMGSGSGAAALPLAEATSARVVAVELVAPLVRRLALRSRANGLSRLILPVLADMTAPPVQPGTVDLVWSEGAAYNLGFAHALRLWQPLLRPGGGIALTELTWLNQAPPREARAFWNKAYPAMTTVDANLAALEAAGFEPLAPFILPEAAWAQFYVPIEAALPAFERRHPGGAAKALAEELHAEIAVRRAYGQSYGYVFYLGRAR
jgi:SAM-dependent methyltransferase